MMKVSELIAMLQKVPQDREVCVFYDFCVGRSLYPESLVLSDNDNSVYICAHDDEEMEHMMQDESMNFRKIE